MLTTKKTLHRIKKNKILLGNETRIGVFLISFLFFTYNASAQVYNLDNILDGQTISTCSGNFYDSGGNGGLLGNYSDNEDYTITFCSDNGTKMAITFTKFKTKNEDILTIYDGPSTGSPVLDILAGHLEKKDGDIPITYISTGTCLTFNFNSLASGAATDDGWEAEIFCSCDGLPELTFNAIPDVCEHAAAFNLTQASPSGGTYSGTGITTSPEFNPAFAGDGTHTITYTYTDGLCTNSIDRDITVIDFPTLVSFTGFNDPPFYCENEGDIVLTGVPKDPNGVFTGSIIDDNLDGTGIFNPSDAGLGVHTITYTYTNLGCADSYSEDVQVGTAISYTGLGTEYCADDADVTFLYDPIGGSFDALVGLTDHGDGSATLSPSNAPSGSQDVSYTYISDGCDNNLTVSVQINALPNVSFAGLNPTGYCVNGSMAILTGNQAPGGIFSGPGMTNNGDGTGTFDPQSLPVGGPYTITYTYTNAVTGCTNSSSQTTYVLALPEAYISSTSTICIGGSANLNVDFTGTGTYDFTYTDGVASNTLLGITDDPYSLSVSPIISSNYTISSVTDDYGCSDAGTGTGTVVVNPEVKITAHPSDESICAGNAVSFSVTATGVGIGYQWYLDGSILSGKTTNPLFLNNIDAADAGVYTCIVSSTCGNSLTSNPGNLTVLPLTTIDTEPLNVTACEGSIINFNTGVSGDNLVYQWEKNSVVLPNGGDISGTQSNNLIISNISLADEDVYGCEIVGTCGTVNTILATLTVDELVTITTQPVSKEVCPGNNTSFSVIAEGTGISYEWQKNGIPIPGETFPTLSLPTVDATDAGTYQCIITGTCNTVSSTAVDLTVWEEITISINPIDEATCESSSADFNVVATGSNLSYQWKLNGTNLIEGGDISGSKTPNLSIINLVTGDAGGYTCLVTNTCGSVTSTTGTLTVDETITITTNLQDKSACPGDNVIFSITTTGTNLNYEWYKSGVLIPGETNSSLLLSTVDAGNVGTYYCKIINACGPTSSDIVSLSLNTLTSINAPQPSDLLGCEGTNGSFVVSASGSNLSYQWSKDGTPVADGGNLSGTNNSALLITSMVLADAGIFSCEVVGTCGTETSTPAVLTVDEFLQIDTNPSNKEVCPGDNTSFSVSVTGTNPSYQWQKNNVNISGATSSTYSLTGVNATNAGNYHCIITGNCNTVSSSAATLTIWEEITLSADPVDLVTCEASIANFSVAVTGSNLIYQWKLNGTNLIEGGDIFGSDDSDLSISNLVAADAGDYSCLITNTCGNETSATAVLTVDKDIVFTTNIQDESVCPGDNVIFDIVTSGTNLTYEWFKDGTLMPGETNSNLVISGAAPSDDDTYYCNVSNACGTKTSNVVDLTLNTNTSINSQPTDIVGCEGNFSSFAISATGSDLVYQWKKDGTIVNDGGSLSGTSNSNLFVNSMVLGDAGIYTCEVIGNCGAENSDPAVLTVNENIQITTQPSSQDVCPGTNVSFQVIATGSNIDYQWELDFAPLGGETSSTIDISNADTGDEGLYRCVITGDCGTVPSNTANLSLYNDISITSQPISLAECSGNDVSFSVSATATGISYQWRKNNVNMANVGNASGVTSSSLSLSSISYDAPSDDAVYTCIISSTCGNESTTPADLIVYDQTSITTDPVDFQAVVGGDASFSITAEGESLSYQWYKVPAIMLSNDAVYSGVTTSILTLSNLDSSHDGSYYCIVTGTCGNATSGSGTLTVNLTTLITTHPTGPLDKCIGEDANFDVVASGTNLTYQWYKDGVLLNNTANISGVTTAGLEITDVQITDEGSYSCLVSGTEGQENSFPAQLNVDEPTVVTTHPFDDITCEGDDALFVIEATGSDLSYQWEKDGFDLTDIGNITGSNETVLSVANLGVADAGDYLCKVVSAGTCGNDNSTSATLTVNQNTQITSLALADKVLCEEATANYSITAIGGNLNYQWRKDGGDIAGANNFAFSIAPLVLGDAGVYTCFVSGACGDDNTNTSILTVNPKTVITSQPVSAVKCENDAVFFSIEAEGSNLNYVWKKETTLLSNGPKISGSNTNILTISDLNSTDEGTYTCFITGDCGDISSSPANLTVNSNVQILLDPINNTECEGGSISLSVASGDVGNTYQWKKDGTNIIESVDYAGTSSTNLNIINLDNTHAGVYSCLVSGLCDNQNSGLANIIVQEATQITNHPVSQNIDEGDPVTFTVDAEGDNLSYQWQLDGSDFSDNANISGSETPILNIAAVDNPTDEGAYTCTVTGSCGSQESDPANLIVYLETQIYTHPEDESLCEGGAAVFSVVATGSNITYQWKKGDANINNLAAKITGANSKDLTILSVESNDEGIYTCVVSGDGGSLNSEIASLTVLTATYLISQPASSIVKCEDDAASFIVEAEGANLVYEWRKDGNPLIDDGRISGSSTSTLIINELITADDGIYICNISGDCGSTTSDPSDLAINSKVNITTNPLDDTKCIGTSISLTVTSSDAANTYQWKKDGNIINDVGNISGTSTNNLIIINLENSNQGIYSCLVTSLCDNQNSGLANVEILDTTYITTHPLSQNIFEGDAATFTVSAEGANLSYQWQKNGANISDFGTISGSETNTLNISSVDNFTDEGAYTCIVTGTCEFKTSNPANLTVNPQTIILTHPEDTTLCEAKTAIFEVDATGDNLTYQWKIGNTNVDNVLGKITGAQTPSLTISSVEVSDEGVYTCIVSGNGGSISTETASLTVFPTTTMNSQSESVITKCTGEGTFFEVDVTGNDLSYVWEKNGVALSNGGNISGATNNILTISDISASDEGQYICFVFSGTCQNVTSDPSSLIVNEFPETPGTIIGDDQICQGETTKYYEIPQISDADSYHWNLPYGVTVVSGENTRFLVVDYDLDALGGFYTVEGVNACGIGPKSNPLNITASPKPEADAGLDQNLCSNTYTMDANITTNGTWSVVEGYADFSDMNLHCSEVQNLSQGSNILEWTVIDNNCPSRDTIIIINNIVPVDAGQDQILCENFATLNANVPSVGTGSWTIESGGGNIIDRYSPNTQIEYLISGTSILKWNINNNGCVSSDPISLTNDLPTKAYAGLDTIIIIDSHNLDGNIPTIGTGTWSLISGSGLIANPLSPTTLLTGLGIGENLFNWTIRNNTCYDSDDIRVFNYAPSIVDAGPDQILCVDYTSLLASRPTYGTGHWTVITGSGTFTDPDKYDTDVIDIGKGVNIFKWTIDEYIEVSDTVSIANNSPFTANAGDTQILCKDSTILAGNDPISYTGEWSIVGGFGIIDDINQYDSKVTSLNRGTNTFKWTVSNGNTGCSSSDNMAIINDKPTDAAAGSDPSEPICADSIYLNPNTPSIGTGEWSVISGSASFDGNKAYLLAIDENILQWTITNNNCSSSDTIVITSNKPTTAALMPDKSICVDSMILPGNTPLHGSIGEWQPISGSTTISDLNDPNALVSNLISGSNRFRWKITYGECSSSSDININYDYVQAEAGEPQEICSSSSFMSANSPSSGIGQWSVVGGSGSANFTNPNQANTEVTNLDRGVNTLQWTITNKSCISTDEIAISNNLPSDAYAGSDRSVCGESIFLNANPPQIGQGTWYVLSGAANIQDKNLSTSEVSNLSLGQNTLRWKIDNKDCSSSDEVVITNNQPSNVSAGPDQFLCADTAQLYSSDAVGGYGRWTIATGSASFEDNTLFNTKVSLLEKGENKLVWTATISGCSNTDTVIITNNLPSLPSAGPNQDICSSETFMAANNPFIGTGRWGIVSGSGIFEDPADPFTKITFVGNGDNILQWITIKGSCNLIDEVIITNNLPTLAYAGEDRAVCNSTANLLANPPNVGTGIWKVVSGFGVIQDPNNFNTEITSLGFGSNTLSWTTENGRCKTSDNVIITNNLSTADAGVDEVVYSPNITLVGNKPSSGAGEWQLAAGMGNIDSPNTFETSVTNLGEGANTFLWTIVNSDCVAFDDVIITYYVLPEIDFKPSFQNGCPPLFVDFVNSSVGGFPFTWDFGDGTNSSKTNPMHTYNSPGTYNVRLTGTGPDEILITKDTTIIVHQLPNAELEITPDLIYVSTPPDPRDEPVHCFNLTEDVDSTIWDFGDGTISNEINPTHIYNETGIYDITLHVYTSNLCYDYETVFSAIAVEDKGKVTCPNAFTPNLDGAGDGYIVENDYSNDVFHCFAEGLLEYHLEIYNRLGIRIFETDDINTGWDGYFHNELVDEGVYVYNISGVYNNGENFSKIGSLILLH